jgi:polyribonucleotide nucleotidyltransferase
VSWERIQNVESVLKVGEEVEVKLLDIDRDNKLRLSRRALLPKPEGYVERPERENRPPRREDGERRDNRDRHDRREGHFRR